MTTAPERFPLKMGRAILNDHSLNSNQKSFLYTSMLLTENTTRYVRCSLDLLAAGSGFSESTMTRMRRTSKATDDGGMFGRFFERIEEGKDPRTGHRYVNLWFRDPIELEDVRIPGHCEWCDRVAVLKTEEDPNRQIDGWPNGQDDGWSTPNGHSDGWPNSHSDGWPTPQPSFCTGPTVILHEANRQNDGYSTNGSTNHSRNLIRAGSLAIYDEIDRATPKAPNSPIGRPPDRFPRAYG